MLNNNNASFKALYSLLDYYVDQEHLSVIPVVEFDFIDEKGSPRNAKTPIGYWKKNQLVRTPKQELLEFLSINQRYSTGIVCGAISGNLEVLDFDTKNWSGIDTLYFTELKQLHPDIFEKLRIHKSRSGGSHVLYKCAEKVEGNKKLATKEGVKEAAIETRGEGGYVVAPPCSGYSVVKDVPIPTLTKQERDSIITLATLFDQKIKEKKVIRSSKTYEEMYDENPFEHFNNSNEAETILEDFGWTVFKDTKKYVHFTRPNKSSGTSAGFIKDCRKYHFFTTSSEFDGDSTYSPSAVLCILKFNNDYKALLKYLVEKGYGKLKANYEKNIVRKAVTNNFSLPNNISDTAREQYEATKSQYDEDFKYGIFWKGDIIDGYVISREQVLQVASQMGYYIFEGNQLCKVDGFIIRKVESRNLFDTLKEYIKDENSTIYYAICDAYESFLQKSGEWTIKRLKIIDDSFTLTSTFSTSYKFYKNCIVKVEKDSIDILQYSELNGKLIWEDSFIQRDFKLIDKESLYESIYIKYLDLAIGIEKNDFQLQKIIGYLAHDFKNELMGYIITLVEEVEDPHDGGGSGKNLFAKMLQCITSTKEVAGSQISTDRNFLQAWNGERIFVLSDLNKDFDYSFLKNISTNSGVLKKLFKDERTIDASKMPKIIVLTNFSFENSDGGLKRRIIPIEFTNYFTINGGVYNALGKYFPNDFDEIDWLGFDNFMILGIQEWLKAPSLVANNLSETGFWKQFVINHKQHIKDFLDMFLSNEEEQWEEKELESIVISEKYKTYCNESNIRFISSIQTLNKAIKEYCDHIGIKYEKDYLKKINGVPKRYSKFKKTIKIKQDEFDFYVPF